MTKLQRRKESGEFSYHTYLSPHGVMGHASYHGNCIMNPVPKVGLRKNAKNLPVRYGFRRLGADTTVKVVRAFARIDRMRVLAVAWRACEERTLP
jgi:hypothetical protein